MSEQRSGAEKGRRWLAACPRRLVGLLLGAGLLLAVLSLAGHAAPQALGPRYGGGTGGFRDAIVEAFLRDGTPTHDRTDDVALYTN